MKFHLNFNIITNYKNFGISESKNNKFITKYSNEWPISISSASLNLITNWKNLKDHRFILLIDFEC